jgi:hypothetical protein
MKIFLSYSSEDGVLADKVKTYLSSYVDDIFMAHEDLPLGVDWDEKILEELELTDLLVFISTSKSNISECCNQEIGYALAKGTPYNILLDGTGKVPPGFISRKQGVKIGRDFEKSMKKLIDEITKHPKYEEKIEDDLIQKLEVCESYKDANKIIKLLLEFESFSIDQIKSIIKICWDNSQVYGADQFKGKLRVYIKEKYFEQLSLEDIEMVDRADDYSWRSQKFWADIEEKPAG